MEIFEQKIDSENSDRLINKIFGHFSILGKVQWRRVVKENANHQCR